MKTRPPTLLDSLAKQLKPVLFHVGAVSFFINLLILPVSLYSLQVMDRVMSTGSMATLFWLTFMMMLLFAVAGMLQTLRGVMLQQVSDWLHGEIAASVLPITLAQAAFASGGRGAQGLRDANALKQFIGGSGITTLLDAPWSILYIFVLYIIHPWLGLLVTVGALLLLSLAWLNESLMRLPVKQAGMQQMQSTQELEFATRNADVIEAMGMAPMLIARWRHTQGKVNALQSQAGGRASVIQGVTKFVRLSLQVMTTGVSAWLALEGHVTMGAIVASSILSSRALSPFEAAISSLKMLTETRHAYGRLQQMLTAKMREQTLSLPVPMGVLAAEQLLYIPPGQKQPILKYVNFRLEAGEILGVIGPSGSGKTTLARVMMGIWPPTGGIVRLDGADVYTWPREEFGRFTGYLPQDVELFGGSVKDNIARMQPDAPAEAIIEAAQLANAHELILRLPNGYETEIGTAGALLSAGQRQRIGLARAFYGSRFLVLDEPDANLDTAGKEALFLALKHAKLKRITTVIISHRKSILAHVDKLLILKSGAVEAFGPPQQVLGTLDVPKRLPGERG